MKNSRPALLILGIILALFSCSDQPPTKDKFEYVIESIEVNSSAHFRGIQAVSDDVVWLSGTGGTVLKTTDGGKKWKDITVPECSDLDFRDIHALDKNRAWVMSSGNGVKVYYTENGGSSWILQFEDANPKVFLDGMDFSDENHGVIYGDPISGVMDVLITADGGANWERISTEKLPQTLEGEAGFAASGTGAVYRGSKIWLATGGGKTCRIMHSSNAGNTWEVTDTGLEGGEGKGIFSMAFKDDLNGVVVGGDYIDSTSVHHNCAFTMDGGKTWEIVETKGPNGYRSCVAIAGNGTAIACGRTGIDRTTDFKKWESVSADGYFTCAATVNTVWLAGRRGKVAKLVLPRVIK